MQMVAAKGNMQAGNLGKAGNVEASGKKRKDGNSRR